jgi:hypothetical protein
VPCKNGDNCKFIHSDEPRPPKIKKDVPKKDKETQEQRDCEVPANGIVDEIAPEKKVALTEKIKKEKKARTADEKVMPAKERERGRAERGALATGAYVEPAQRANYKLARSFSYNNNKGKRYNCNMHASNYTEMLANLNFNNQIEYYYAMQSYQYYCQPQVASYPVLVAVPVQNGVYVQYAQALCAYYPDNSYDFINSFFFLHVCSFFLFLFSLSL